MASQYRPDTNCSLRHSIPVNCTILTLPIYIYIYIRLTFGCRSFSTILLIEIICSVFENFTKDSRFLNLLLYRMIASSVLSPSSHQCDVNQWTIVLDDCGVIAHAFSVKTQEIYFSNILIPIRLFSFKKHNLTVSLAKYTTSLPPLYHLCNYQHNSRILHTLYSLHGAWVIN